MKARKKPVIIDCFKYDGYLTGSEGFIYAPAWFAKAFYKGIAYYKETEKSPSELFVKTLEGEHHISVGDYVIRGVKGEIYACKPDIFEMTYDVVCDNEIDVQLTIEEIEALGRYYQELMKIISRNMLNIFEIAYTVDNYDLELCVKAIDKLQKQKEMLENER